MLYGLDLFSGIAGNSLALEPWVRTVAYCEREPYAQGVLLSRMADGTLPPAPIWDDVTTLDGHRFRGVVDIIVGGFPCQDISVAGRGAGLEGKRSGLFFQVVRLAEEIKPAFVFLENVPAIRTRGASRVVQELSSLGYDCRWTTVSAADVGAPHLRNRWFLLAAHPERLKLWDEQGRSSGACGRSAPLPRNDGEAQPLADGESLGRSEGRPWAEVWGGGNDTPRGSGGQPHTRVGLADSSRTRLEGSGQGLPGQRGGWELEPDVGRVAHGVPSRVDRIKCLGNAVVPAQAREAFRRLMGIPRG